MTANFILKNEQKDSIFRAPMMARDRQRVRLEDGLKLDLNRLIRQHVVRPGALRRSTIRWSHRFSDEEVASGRLSADVTRDGRGWLRIELGGLDQRIDLVGHPRHYGGHQWYFLCPQTGRRASVLCKPPGARSFACRQTWGRQVAYGSQFETPYDRALSAAQDIRYRLGGKDYISLLDGVRPPKPKGMHRQTYEQILRRCESYEAIANQHLVRFLVRLRR
jgi:hypothetical protein